MADSSIQQIMKANQNCFRSQSVSLIAESPSPALPPPRRVPLNPMRRVRGPGLQLAGPVLSPGVPRSERFMGRGNLQRLDANRGHEPGRPLTPSLSPTGGEGWGEGGGRVHGEAQGEEASRCMCRERFFKTSSRFESKNRSSRKEAHTDSDERVWSLLTSAATSFMERNPVAHFFTGPKSAHAGYLGTIVGPDSDPMGSAVFYRQCTRGGAKRESRHQQKFSRTGPQGGRIC